MINVQAAISCSLTAVSNVTCLSVSVQSKLCTREATVCLLKLITIQKLYYNSIF